MESALTRSSPPCTFRNSGRGNECPIIEQKLTSCVLKFGCGKTYKQAVAHGRLVVGAIEMTSLFASRSFLTVSESGGVENIKIDK
jgi:hypothetical protein